jgi:hypothetical protein
MNWPSLATDLDTQKARGLRSSSSYPIGHISRASPVAITFCAGPHRNFTEHSIKVLLQCIRELCECSIGTRGGLLSSPPSSHIFLSSFSLLSTQNIAAFGSIFFIMAITYKETEISLRDDQFSHQELPVPEKGMAQSQVIEDNKACFC